MIGGLATSCVVGVRASMPSRWSQAYTRTWPYSGVSPLFCNWMPAEFWPGWKLIDTGEICRLAPYAAVPEHSAAASTME